MDPIPETMGICEFLSFISELDTAKKVAYERARKRAIGRGENPDHLVG